MNVDDICQSILRALPPDTSLSGSAPKREWVYLPVGHLKALGLESSLVVGARGVGKSFWWAALQEETIRLFVSRYSLNLSNLPKLVVSAGYGEKPNISVYPDMGTFRQLIDKGHEPLQVWRAVAARWVAAMLGEIIPSESWEQTVLWVTDSPEIFARNMERADANFEQQGRHGLIVFDALDRTSHDWRSMDLIVRDLLRFVLYLKPFSHLHAKVFLREDQFEGRNVKEFPDASKLLATRVDLTWGSLDLHGLLWQYLINASGEAGATMRILLHESSTTLDVRDESGVFAVPELLRRDEKLQRQAFVRLAGEWMGKDRRRGIPYVWGVGHLADSRGRVSPRSFIAAIRSAAEESLAYYPDRIHPLHYESIKRGVQKASQTRVDELVTEDYPWVKRLMDPLEGVTVPCDFSEIERRWKESGALEETTFTEDRLPPEHLEKDGAAGVRRDLEALGIFERMKDQRVNMPDLYRVGFRLGRRGGVKPAARTSRSS